MKVNIFKCDICHQEVRWSSEAQYASFLQLYSPTGRYQFKIAHQEACQDCCKAFLDAINPVYTARVALRSKNDGGAA